MVGQWTGALTRALRVALRMPYRTFAEYLGAGARTVANWESDPQTVPELVHQEALDTALGRATPTQQTRFVALLRSDPSGSMSNLAVHAGEESGTDRRDASKTLVIGVAALTPLGDLERIAATVSATGRVDSKLVADHEDLGDTLGRLHRTARSDALIGLACHHADTLLGLLERPMSTMDRRRLDVVAVGSCAQAGLLSFSSRARTTARRYFALAQSVAGDSGNEALRAQALVVTSELYSPIPQGGRGGNVRRAVELLSEAAERAQPADPPTRQWVHRRLAMELAAAGDERGFHTNMEQADLAQDAVEESECRGFLQRYSLSEGQETGASRGLGLVLLAQPEAAIEFLFTALAVTPPGWDKWKVARLSDTAAAFVLLKAPEAACRRLSDALVLAVAVDYKVGVERVRGVRACFPAEWPQLACVRELDERLRLAG